MRCDVCGDTGWVDVDTLPDKQPCLWCDRGKQIWWSQVEYGCTPLMRQSRAAAERVRQWSAAKRDYAIRQKSREQLMALKYFCDICDAEGAGRASFTFSGQMQFNRDLCRKHFEELAALIKAWESAPKAHGMAAVKLEQGGQQ